MLARVAPKLRLRRREELDEGQEEEEAEVSCERCGVRRYMCIALLVTLNSSSQQTSSCMDICIQD